MNSLSLLICQESGGRAMPLARVNDIDLLRIAGAVAINQQRSQARLLRHAHPKLASASRAQERALNQILSGLGDEA